jgi:Cu2+-exporting ATPase
MSCAACSARVEKAVSSLEGVEICSVNLLTNSMEVEGSATDSEIITAVIKAGYGAESVDSQIKRADKKSNKAKANAEIRALRNRFLVSLSFLLVLMYVSMGHNMWGFPLPQFLEGNSEAIAILQMILCVIIMAINKKFFTSGFKSAIKLAPNMDTLVSLGSGASFIYSVVLVFTMTSANADKIHILHGLYFESAAMILVLITLGKMLEAIAKGKTTDALDKLTSLAPESATVIRDGKEIAVPISEVLVGDIFTVRPGESIAVDGIVIEGESAVDESALTGESIPVDKAAGANVYSATINRSGFLKCRATEVGDETMLSRIIKMVSDASSSKAPIAKIADKVSGIFVPTVIGISIVTFIVWTLLDKELGFALTRAISVLVISCPCALGLATPVSIMVVLTRISIFPSTSPCHISERSSLSICPLADSITASGAKLAIFSTTLCILLILLQR